MKHFIQLALLGTVALVAAGCQREMVQKVPDNPTYNAKTGDVTTQFVLSVSTEAGTATKQTADVVQANGQAFRGMRAVHLLVYQLDPDNNGTNKRNGEFFMYNPTAAGKATRDYDMGNMLTANEISAAQSSRILELSLPLKSNAMLLYSLPQKPEQGSMSTVDYNNKYGAVTAGTLQNNGTIDTQSGSGFTTDLTKARFELVNRLTNQAAFTGFGQMMGDMMTGFIRTACTGNRTYAYWWPQDQESKNWSTRTGNTETGVVYTGSEIPSHPGYTYVTGEASWAAMGHDYKLNHDADPSNDVAQSYLQEALGEAYYQMVSIKSKDNKEELRAGSAASILRTLRDLYDVLVRVQNATVSEQEDQVAKEMAKEILYRIKKFFSIENNTLVYKDIQEMKAAISTIYVNDMNTTFEAKCGNIELNSSFLCDNVTYEGGFPLNLGLPMSSALLATKDLNDGKGLLFYYRNAVPAYGMDAAEVPITYYRYPPELMYWANSGLRVSDLTHTKLEYPKTVSDWATNASSSNDYWKTTKIVDNESVTDWVDNGAVSSTTRSVAVMKQVNYGVALLEAHTGYASDLPTDAGGAYVEDNNSGIHEDEKNNKIYINSNSFLITGIIIGGVCDRVGWDYCSIGSNDEDGNIHNKLIYDYVGEQLLPASGSVITYTPTWDSYLANVDSQGQYTGQIGTPEDQHDVYLAVELKNNTGKDIWGELNLIRDGGTFYLVGKMDLAAAKSAAVNAGFEWPSDLEYHYPPFNPATGETIKVQRVFMQDYTTVANLKFGKNSLSHAYVTVPDLRASQVSLGLSVDIQWRSGLTFDVNLGEMN